jgi:hypothetical protein
MTNLQCIDEDLASNNVEQFNVARTYVKDIITMALTIGEVGSIERLYTNCKDSCI